MMPRVVLDTSVFVSALITLHGRPDAEQTATVKLLRAFQREAFTAVTSGPLIAELRAALLKPHVVKVHGLSRREVYAFVLAYRRRCDVAPGRPRPRVPGLIKRDRKDIPILAAAINGSAEIIVMKDHDLSDLAPAPELTFRGIKIFWPSEACRALGLRK